MTIQKVGVVGLGTMGAGIVEVFAKAGFPVVGMDVSEAAIERGRGIITTSTGRAVEKGKLSAEGAQEILDRITFTADLAHAAGCDLVVEAAFEDLQVKKQIFTQLEAAAPQAILASNTSSLSVTDIADTVSNRERVLGVHFFNPAPVQRLVEVVRTKYTSQETVDAVLEILATLKKNPIVIGDRAGFVVNALLITYLNDAISLYGKQFATREEMDAALVEAGNPMGPLTLADLIGNDVNLAIMQRMFSDTGRELHRPAALLEQMCADGRLGRKTGKGFYTYDGSDDSPVVQPPVQSRAADLPDRLVACYLNEVLRMVSDGYATPAQIDTGMTQGCRMPAPFDQLAQLGAVRVRETLDRYVAEGETELAPVDLLIQLAESDDPVAALAELRQRS